MDCFLSFIVNISTGYPNRLFVAYSYSLSSVLKKNFLVLKISDSCVIDFIF